jgi:hypothetical protein
MVNQFGRQTDRLKLHVVPAKNLVKQIKKPGKKSRILLKDNFYRKMGPDTLLKKRCFTEPPKKVPEIWKNVQMSPNA